MKTRITTELLTEAIQSAKLEYLSDTSWAYHNTIQQDKISIDFYQDETGQNHIEEFCIKQKGIWIAILPTDEQVKLMFKMLNDTPYREVEIFEEIDDLYFHNGVKQADFY